VVFGAELVRALQDQSAKPASLWAGPASQTSARPAASRLAGGFFALVEDDV
jgi:hypothetical protein